MSNFLRFTILFGVISAVFSHNVRDDAAWFKERERITDQFLVGMINGRNTRCHVGMGNRGNVEGTCLPQRECTNLGGMRAGSCSLLGTCCILEKTCGQVTSSKLSYFVPPKVHQPDCSLTVKPMNGDVCQIRLDFEKFSIAQPTQGGGLEFGSRRSFQCYNDAFTVNNGGAYLGFEHLCGENAKQHIYIPVTNQGNVVLRFQLNLKRDSADILGRFPDWKIRIRQLECRNNKPGRNHTHSILHMMHRNHSHPKPSPPPGEGDVIAPTNCLQYYTARTGFYESFNFNNGQGPYIGKTKYAICFRRTPDVCGIRHATHFFLMNYNVREDTDPLEIECHRGSQADEVTSQDSLHIPGGMVNNQYVEYFCNGQLTNQTVVTSTVPGPFYVAVRTDAFRAFDRVEIGFRMQYHLQNTGCDLPY